VFNLSKVKQPFSKLLGIIASSPLRRRLIKGLGANAFGQVVTITVQLTSVPLFLHFWGADLYGKWLILYAMPGYLAMSDIGFASVAGNEMTMLTARQDYEEALRVFQSAWVFITSVCSAIGLVVIALAYLLPFDSWFKLEPLPRAQVSLVICLLALYTLVSQQGELIDGAFRSDGRYAQGTLLNNVVRVLELLLTLTSVSLGGQLVAAALALLIGRILGLCWMWLMFRRTSQWLSFGYAKAHLETIQVLFRPAVAFMAFPLSSALLLQGMTLIVGGVLGSVAVVVFTTSRTVTRIVIQFLGLITRAIWPELSSAFGSGDLLLARKIYQKASLLSVWLSLVASIVLAFVGPWLLRAWTGRHIVIDIPLFYLMLLLVISTNLWQTSIGALMATNRHGDFAKIALIGSIGGIILAYVLLKVIGLIAAPLALLVADIFMGFYAVRKALALLKLTFSEYLRALFNLRSALN